MPFDTSELINHPGSIAVRVGMTAAGLITRASEDQEADKNLLTEWVDVTTHMVLDPESTQSERDFTAATVAYAQAVLAL